MSEQTKPLTTHHSYWIREQTLKRRFDKITGIHQTDVAVLGAGITGLSTAIELLDQGLKVTVLEALVVGGGTTTGSSGHLDAHPEQGPRKFITALGEEKACLATRVRLDAIDTIERRADSRCDFQRISAFQYSERAEDEGSLRDEMKSAATLGLQVKWPGRVPLPYAAVGYEISGMARFQSMAYLERLLQIFLEKGGKLFEQSVASGPVEEHPTELEVGDGKIQFERLVCAVHCNYTDVMRIYLQTPAYQSYVLAARVKDPCEDALFWDTSDPYFYTRRANSHTPNLIIVGGCDHRTGAGDPMAAQAKLHEFVAQRYDVEEIVCTWSAELYEPTDGFPIIGRVPGKKNVWIATGLSGIGLTWGTAAAKIIAQQMGGNKTDLDSELSPARFGLSGALTMVGEQMVAVANVTERILPARTIEIEKLSAGKGQVGNVDGKFTAACRDKSGNVHLRNPRCVHMGGVVHWNEAEQTWDCPVHGGRYAACGARITSPPESDLVAPEEKAEE